MFSESSLRTLHYISNGYDRISDLADILGVSSATIYSAIGELRKQGVICQDSLSITANAAWIRLANVMSYSADRSEVLAGRGIDVLMHLRSPCTVDEISKRTGVARATAYRRIASACAMGAVKKCDRRYVLNDHLWPELRGMLDSIEDLYQVFDPRVATGSIIYYHDVDRVLYSNPRILDDQHAAFSRFPDFGIDAGLNTTYYTTSVKPQTINTVFDDSLLIAERTGDYMLRMGVIILYLRNRKLAETHPDFETLVSKILEGRHVDGWPDLIDLRDRVPGLD